MHSIATYARKNPFHACKRGQGESEERREGNWNGTWIFTEDLRVFMCALVGTREMKVEIVKKWPNLAPVRTHTHSPLLRFSILLQVATSLLRTAWLSMQWGETPIKHKDFGQYVAVALALCHVDEEIGGRVDQRTEIGYHSQHLWDIVYSSTLYLMKDSIEVHNWSRNGRRGTDYKGN